MNMRERLAKRLFLVDYPKDEWERLDAGRGSYNQDRYRVKADAVLDELMTPTEGMLKQSFAAMNDTPSGEWKRLKAAGLTERQMFDAKMRPRYTAMIKAAKEGK